MFGRSTITTPSVSTPYRNCTHQIPNEQSLCVYVKSLQSLPYWHPSETQFDQPEGWGSQLWYSVSPKQSQLQTIKLRQKEGGKKASSCESVNAFIPVKIPFPYTLHLQTTVLKVAFNIVIALYVRFH